MSRKKAGMSANAKWGIAFLIEIVVMFFMVVGYFFFYANRKLDNINRPTNWDDSKENLDINEDANEAQKGYRTIALFGIDSRSTTSMAEGNRSDSIIIASINNDTKEVKLASVYRDSLLQVDYDGGITTKITHAYAYGGPEMAVRALNANLDLEITDFVTVNFTALAQAIDDLGGITIDVREAELEMLNACITEQIGISGQYSDGVFSAGTQLLNGTQATGWARIRSTDQGDITRTERQRTVIAKMIQKAKSSDLSTINDIIDDVFPNIYTSLTKKELMSLAKDMFDYSLGDTIGFPMAYAPVTTDAKGAVLVPADLTTNVSALHEFLFGTQDYTPTSKVQGISSSLQSETLVQHIISHFVILDNMWLAIFLAHDTNFFFRTRFADNLCSTHLSTVDGCT
jgi:LCP family protein required for cell wall assembly